MKSHPKAGQYKLKGRKEAQLSCKCCIVQDKREEEIRKEIRKEISKEIRQAWYDENDKDTSNLSPRDIGLRIGLKSGLIKALNIVNKE